MLRTQSRHVRRFVFMKVNVRVRLPVMAVLVDVNVLVLLQRSPERTDAQTNDHDRDTKLEPTTHSFRNRHPQTQHDRCDNQQ